MTIEQRVYCWLHRWSTWADIGEGTEKWIWEKHEKDVGRPILVQERRCRKCNYCERRTVRL